MTPDSPVADDYVPSLGVSRGLRPRTRDTAVIVHVTGSGPLRRLSEQRFDRWRKRHLTGPAGVLDAAVAVYRGVSPYSGHYVVGPHGRCVQTVPEDLAAQHVGASGSWRYGHEHWEMSRDYEWWEQRWPALENPIDLAHGRMWEDGSVNSGSIGIELAWPYDRERTPPTDAQWDTLRRLVVDVCERRGIPFDSQSVVGHSDAHPVSRTSRGAPWDPPPWWGPEVVTEWCRSRGEGPKKPAVTPLST